MTCENEGHKLLLGFLSLPQFTEQPLFEGAPDHMEIAAGSPGVSQLISAGMVRLYKEKQLGRGPTKARTWVLDDMVVTVLADSLTKAEETLTNSDLGETVRDLRRTLQAAMTTEMTKLIEETMQREVICVLSDHSPDPDYAVEVILLAPQAGSSNGN